MFLPGDDVGVQEASAHHTSGRHDHRVLQYRAQGHDKRAPGRVRGGVSGALQDPEEQLPNNHANRSVRRRGGHLHQVLQVRQEDSYPVSDAPQQEALPVQGLRRESRFPVQEGALGSGGPQEVHPTAR